MMIRINLLPVRKKVQREMGRQILALFALVLVGAGVGNFFWYSDRDGVVQPGPAPRFSRTPGALTTPPVPVGHDTRSALLAWGIDDADALIESRVAIPATPPDGRDNPRETD